MMKKRLVPKRIQPVYSYPEDDRARLVMIEAMKNGGAGVIMLPPLYISINTRTYRIQRKSRQCMRGERRKGERVCYSLYSEQKG